MCVCVRQVWPHRHRYLFQTGVVHAILVLFGVLFCTGTVHASHHVNAGIWHEGERQEGQERETGSERDRASARARLREVLSFGFWVFGAWVQGSGFRVRRETQKEREREKESTHGSNPWHTVHLEFGETLGEDRLQHIFILNTSDTYTVYLIYILFTSSLVRQLARTAFKSSTADDGPTSTYSCLCMYVYACRHTHASTHATHMHTKP